MVKLFKYEGYTVTVEPEALMLAPFKAIWQRDKSKDKSKAMQELSFIYFMEDPRSDYQYLVDEEVRASEIKKGEGLPDNWKPDKVVQRAIEFYRSFVPASAGLLEDTRFFVNSLRKELRTRAAELNDLDMKELKSAMELIKQVPTLCTELDNAERTLARDILQEARARGSQTKALYEDEAL